MILIFDYFETLVGNRSIDFNRALIGFWAAYYKDKCSFDEIKEYGEELFSHLLDLHRQGKEFAFVREELPMYAQRYGGESVQMSAEEEADFLMKTNDMEPMDGIEDVLNMLQSRGIPMYVLSNSGFSAAALSIALQRLGLGEYFNGIFSSADFGVIKPCRELYDTVINKALADNPGEKRENIVFVGDTYESDIAGALGAGIKAVWIHSAPDDRENAPYVFRIDTVRSLPEVVNRLPG